MSRLVVTVTPETLTDSQIRALRTLPLHADGRDAYHQATLALYGTEFQQRRARQRCAEIINARNTEAK